MRQSDLWKRLNVVRSVISEMLGALLELGWVKRARAPDGRTWIVQLTKVGRDVFERAYDRWVESGDVALAMDAALCRRHVELDAERKRLELIYACETLDAEFRGIPWGHGGHVYPWDPEDYYQDLTYPGEPDCGIPWVA